MAIVVIALAFGLIFYTLARQTEQLDIIMTFVTAVVMAVIAFYYGIKKTTDEVPP